MAVTGSDMPFGEMGEIGLSRLLLVGHDAFPAGAQRILLEIGRSLVRRAGIETEFLLLGGGLMEPAYREVAATHLADTDAELAERSSVLAARGFTTAFVNTVAASHAVPVLQAAGIKTVLLVHELPELIRARHLGEATRIALMAAQRIVFPAPFVRDAVLAEVGLPVDHRMAVRPQGLYRQIEPNGPGAARIREELNLAATARLILGIGYADIRKGFDLFLQLGDLVRRHDPHRDVHLCWVGDMDPEMRARLHEDIAAAEATGRFHLAGQRADVGNFLHAADALLLTSREDPFPSVVLEALATGLPTIAFDHSGGMPALLREHGVGHVVSHGDVEAMADELSTLLRGEAPDLPARRRRLIAECFDWQDYVTDLLEFSRPQRPAAVSAVVPNYNYAHYMPARLGSIFDQTYPVHEVLALDDCSNDDSLTVIPRVAAEAGRAVRLVANAVNSGSTFEQWRKGAELARGEFVWIAEADDLSSPDFLAATVSLLEADPDVRLAFTDSRTVLGDGTPQWDSYKEYYATVEHGALARTEIFAGEDFVRRFLAVKNLILNVSAVVWRREALLESLQACEAELRGYKMAGDWRLYLEVLRRPGARIGYDARPLNVHRRHAESVTHALAAGQHLAEIELCHRAAAAAFPSIADEIAARQQAYRGEVAAQLGVRTPQSDDAFAAWHNSAR